MKFIASFLPLAVGISCVLGIVYLVVQQDIRIGANDPQIQIAEDSANSLNSGTMFSLSGEKVDIGQSLAPFSMIFDTQGHVLQSQALLHKTVPTVPGGVFDNVTKSGEERFTWQPEDGVRIAAVVTAYNNGFVLVGRNLREVEKREDALFNEIFFGWIAAMVISFVCVRMLSLWQVPNKKK